MITILTFSSRAGFGFENKQFVARITGRHPKWTFDREFIGTKTGKRKDGTTAKVDDPGLYQERNIDNKGRATNRYYAVWSLGGKELDYAPISEDEAMGLAKDLDSGRASTVVAQFAEAKYAKILRGSRAKDPNEEINVTGYLAGMEHGKHLRSETINAREAALRKMRGEPDPAEEAAEGAAGAAEKAAIVARDKGDAEWDWALNVLTRGDRMRGGIDIDKVSEALRIEDVETAKGRFRKAWLDFSLEVAEVVAANDYHWMVVYPVGSR